MTHVSHVSGNMEMETVWGGGGKEITIGEGNVEFKFSKLKSEGVKSSVMSGQIPTLLYVS